MSPPVVAQTIVAISAPPLDADSISGDLHEEYVRILAREGRSRADAWYWSQALRSIPPLLSYSRASRSMGSFLVTSALVLLTIVAMLSVNELIDDGVANVFRLAHGMVAWQLFFVGCADAAVFGAIIAALRRSYGMRLIVFSACALLAFIAVPILLHLSSRLTGATWILILAAAFSMCVGGAAYHAVARRVCAKD